jgi:hypothetical protein
MIQVLCQLINHLKSLESQKRDLLFLPVSEGVKYLGGGRKILAMEQELGMNSRMLSIS